MADTDNKDLRVREKQEVAPQAEQTRPGIVFTPSVDIFETNREITLLADLPGVIADKLAIDLRDNTLTLSAEVDTENDKDEAILIKEYETGKYHRQFTLSEVIDQAKINASLNDGVLRLVLPKIEKAAPRKIEIKAG